MCASTHRPYKNKVARHWRPLYIWCKWLFYVRVEPMQLGLLLDCVCAILYRLYCYRSSSPIFHPEINVEQMTEMSFALVLYGCYVCKHTHRPYKNKVARRWRPLYIWCKWLFCVLVEPIQLGSLLDCVCAIWYRLYCYRSSNPFHPETLLQAIVARFFCVL